MLPATKRKICNAVHLAVEWLDENQLGEVNEIEEKMKELKRIMAGSMGPAIGIDFGTCYSSIGVWHNGHVEIISDEQDNTRIPSYVAFTDTQSLLGVAAKRQGFIYPINTIFGKDYEIYWFV